MLTPAELGTVAFGATVVAISTFVVPNGSTGDRRSTVTSMWKSIPWWIP